MVVITFVFVAQALACEGKEEVRGKDDGFKSHLNKKLLGKI